MHGIELLEKGIHELNLEISENQKKTIWRILWIVD